jgi:coenzyme F420-reducing hydrogenase delta subunit
MCSGRVDPVFIFEAFCSGADGVMVGGCKLGECKYITGNFQALLMAEVVKTIMRLIGMKEERLKIEWLSAAEPNKLVEGLKNFFEIVGELGPLGKAEGWSEEDKNFYLASAIKLCNNLQFRSIYGNLSKELTRLNDFSPETITKKIETKLLPVLKNKLYELEIKELLKDGPKSVDYILAKLKAKPEEVEKILNKVILGGAKGGAKSG